MMLRWILTAAAVSALLASAASAAPVVVDPNFDQTVTAAPYYYGIAGWGAVGAQQGDPAYDPSFAGNVGFDVMNQWNNGLPGNGRAVQRCWMVCTEAALLHTRGEVGV